MTIFHRSFRIGKRPLKDLYALSREDYDDKEVSKLYSYCMEIVVFRNSMKKRDKK